MSCLLDLGLHFGFGLLLYLVFSLSVLPCLVLSCLALSCLAFALCLYLVSRVLPRFCQLSVIVFLWSYALKKPGRCLWKYCCHHRVRAYFPSFKQCPLHCSRSEFVSVIAFVLDLCLAYVLSYPVSFRMCKPKGGAPIDGRCKQQKYTFRIPVSN